MVLGRSSELQVLRQNKLIFNRKYWYHFCGSHPYFQREGCVSSRWPSSAVESSFVLPSWYLSYSLCSGCWYCFHISSSSLPFPPGKGEMGPQRDRDGTLMSEKERLAPGTLCHCEQSFFRCNPWGSCHSCFITKGWSSLWVQQGRALLPVSACNPRHNYCWRACLSSFFPLFVEYTIFFSATHLQDTKHSQFHLKFSLLSSRVVHICRAIGKYLSVYINTILRLQLSFLEKNSSLLRLCSL